MSNVARLYRLALEHHAAGALWHAVAEEGVPMRDIAEVIGAGLVVPVRSRPAESKPPQNLREKVEVVEGSHGGASIADRAFDGATGAAGGRLLRDRSWTGQEDIPWTCRAAQRS